MVKILKKDIIVLIQNHFAKQGKKLNNLKKLNLKELNEVIVKYSIVKCDTDMIETRNRETARIEKYMLVNQIYKNEQDRQLSIIKNEKDRLANLSKLMKHLVNGWWIRAYYKSSKNEWKQYIMINEYNENARIENQIKRIAEDLCKERNELMIESNKKRGTVKVIHIDGPSGALIKMNIHIDRKNEINFECWNMILDKVYLGKKTALKLKRYQVSIDSMKKRNPININVVIWMK